MANQPATQYWVWHEERRQYYHAEWNPQTGDWQYIWHSGSINSPSPIPSSGGDAYTSSLAAGAALLGKAVYRNGTQGGNSNYSYQPSTQESTNPEPRNFGLGSLNLTTARLANSEGRPHHEPGSPSSPSASQSPATSRTSYGFDQGSNTQGYPGAGYSSPQGYHPDQAQHTRGRGLRRPSYSSSGNVDPSYLAVPGTSNNHGYLNPMIDEFKLMTPSRNYFVLGKVFIMFYIENAGPNRNPIGCNNSAFTSVAHGEWAHHQFRRFVVVREVSDEFFCECCPITTYSGQATTKKGVNQSTHTIVYSGHAPPSKLPLEINMNKDAIKINLDSQRDKLDPKSRINLGKIITIDHNVKVKPIGAVDQRSLPKLLHYVRSIRNS